MEGKMTVAFMASSHFVRFNPEYFTHPLTHPTEEWHANPQYPASQSANKPLPTSSVTRNSYPAVTLLSTICGAFCLCRSLSWKSWGLRQVRAGIQPELGLNSVCSHWGGEEQTNLAWCPVLLWGELSGMEQPLLFAADGNKTHLLSCVSLVPSFGGKDHPKFI